MFIGLDPLLHFTAGWNIWCSSEKAIDLQDILILTGWACSGLTTLTLLGGHLKMLLISIIIAREASCPVFCLVQSEGKPASVLLT